MPKVDWKGDALAKLAEGAVVDIARQTAETVKGKAVELCPLSDETTVPGGPHGQTRNSATITDLPKGAEISFNTPQAAWLHECMTYHPSHPGTGPNYLRGPLLENESKYHDDIAAALKGIWG